VIDTLQKRLQAWQNRYVSLGGRLILINSVLASIPIFYLSFMKMPVNVWKKLVVIQRNFLWGGASGKKKSLGSNGLMSAALRREGVLG
jgi:hypothetical protein